MNGVTPDPTPQPADNELSVPARPELSEEEQLQIVIQEMRTLMKNQYESFPVAIEGYEGRKVFVGTVLTISENRDDFTVRLAIDTRKKLFEINDIVIPFKRLITGEVTLRDPEPGEKKHMHFWEKDGGFGHLLPPHMR